MAPTEPWRTALVTGASSGIGAAMADVLAARGCDLVLVARRTDRLAETAERLAMVHGTDIEVIGADLTDPDQTATVEARIRDTERPLDLVVNNAGMSSGGRFWNLDIDAEATQVELNVTTLMRLSHAALATMVPRGRGGLCNVSSVGSFQPAPTNATYVATKAFVTSFTQSLHSEVRGTGVHVSALCPGYTWTEFADFEGSGIPGWVISSAEEVARAGLDAVGRNQAVCVPGRHWRAVVAASRRLPLSAQRALAARVNGA